jgi:hypothetical protein
MFLVKGRAWWGGGSFPSTVGGRIHMMLCHQGPHCGTVLTSCVVFGRGAHFSHITYELELTPHLHTVFLHRRDHANEGL